MSTTDSTELTAPLSIPRLRADLNGRVIAPGDEGYDQARMVVYGAIDRRPAVIVKVADVDDVVARRAPRARDGPRTRDPQRRPQRRRPQRQPRAGSCSTCRT